MCLHYCNIRWHIVDCSPCSVVFVQVFLCVRLTRTVNYSNRYEFRLNEGPTKKNSGFTPRAPLNCVDWLVLWGVWFSPFVQDTYMTANGTQLFTTYWDMCVWMAYGPWANVLRQVSPIPVTRVNSIHVKRSNQSRSHPLDTFKHLRGEQ